MSHTHIDISEVFALCGGSSFGKGADLSQKGSVREIRLKGDIVSATVQGTERYQVRLTLSPSFFAQCTCPTALPVSGHVQRSATIYVL